VQVTQADPARVTGTASFLGQRGEHDAVGGEPVLDTGERPEVSVRKVEHQVVHAHRLAEPTMLKECQRPRPPAVRAGLHSRRTSRAGLADKPVEQPATDAAPPVAGCHDQIDAELARPDLPQPAVPNDPLDAAGDSDIPARPSRPAGGVPSGRLVGPFWMGGCKQCGRRLTMRPREWMDPDLMFRHGTQVHARRSDPVHPDLADDIAWIRRDMK
jgi:hypothetical protein